MVGKMTGSDTEIKQVHYLLWYNLTGLLQCTTPRAAVLVCCAQRVLFPDCNVNNACS